MRYRGQPEGNHCAHACLAMLTGQRVPEVLAEVGHPEGLITLDIIGHLRRHRMRPRGDRFRRLRRGEDPPVPLALCTVTWYEPEPGYLGSLIEDFRRDDRANHLLVWAEGRYWDPYDRLIRDRAAAEMPTNPAFRGLMTSYLEVRR